jgi:hypothetical protein
VEGHGHHVGAGRFIGRAPGMASAMTGGSADELVLSDPAMEQVYDELLARAWALRSALGGPESSSEELRSRLANRALEVVRCLRAGHDVEELRVWLARLLWPVSAPPSELDPWWRTPLGVLLAVQSRAEAPHAA